MADFDASLKEGIAYERRLDWQGALRHYDSLLGAVEEAANRNPSAQSRISSVQIRRGNALMVLRRMDEARQAFDSGLHAAKAAGDPLALAKALMAAGVFAGTSGDASLAERFLLDALDRFSRIPGAEGEQGGGWALLNLGGIYGKTGRLDLAFVTLEKSRERLHAIENWVGVAAAWEAQAQLRRAIGDEDRWREDLAEAVVFYDREGMREKTEQLRAILKGKLL